MGDKTVDELKGDIASYQEQLLKHYTREDELLVSVDLMKHLVMD